MRLSIPLLFLLCASAGAQVDLTPRMLVRDLEGSKLVEVALSDGEKSITYQPPDGWTYTGGKDRLSLDPRSPQSAIAAIEQIPAPPPQKLDDKVVDALTGEMLRTVPRGSTDVALLARGPSPIVMDRHETYQIVIAYTIGGRSFVRSTVFLNLDKSQLRFQLVAVKSEFDSLQAAFQRSLCTWQWVERD